MSKYLISFPSPAMKFPESDLEAVAHAAHEVLREAKAAGVWIFGGGIDESIAAVMVESDGTLREGTYPQTAHIEGGYAVLELASYEQAVAWAAKFAAACRCAQEVRVFQDDPEN